MSGGAPGVTTIPRRSKSSSFVRRRSKPERKG